MYLDFFSDILFPPACLVCARELDASVLCPACERSIEIYKTLFCGTCGARLPELKKICHRDAAYVFGAATRYDDASVQTLIRALKFHGVRGAATPLAGLLIRYLEGLYLSLDNFTIIPIPLSSKRLLGRGFNQSQLIRRIVAEHFSLRLEENLLLRSLHNTPQSETDDIFERRENIRGFFSLVDGFASVLPTKYKYHLAR